ncbi:MAG TPA: NAD(P)-dependent oxidoreductase [Actinobacteria bacterium]|nr:NAD(P)-dependent oxidoreductase [Actinomycetota bacterium]
MNPEDLVISKGTLKKNQLNGKIAIISGAGRGIGYETARSLVWLGAEVIIAEINKKSGKEAERRLNEEFGSEKVFFIHTDVSKENSIRNLEKIVDKRFKKVDIIVNNAINVYVGAVHIVGIKTWDLSYQTNLRGPILLTTYFLPRMLERNEGIIVFVSSSGAAPYIGAYEVFKTAQVELSNTLAGELENTKVITFTIGPGIAKTEGLMENIPKIAAFYGKTVGEFLKMTENAAISVEAAGAGYAAAVALAHRYRGLETSSFQALVDAGIKTESDINEAYHLFGEKKDAAFSLISDIRKTLLEQSEAWQKKSIFERQWIFRDFKKHTGAAPEYFLSLLGELEMAIKDNDEIPKDLIRNLQIQKLADYWKHQLELLKGYEKDQKKFKEYSEAINGWIKTIDNFIQDCCK